MSIFCRYSDYSILLYHYINLITTFGGFQQRVRGTTTTKTTITTIIQICDSMASAAYLEQSPFVQVLLDLGRLEPHDDGHDGGRCDQRGVCKVQKYAIEVGHGCGRRLSGQCLDSRNGGVPERHSRDESVHRRQGQDSLVEDSCGNKEGIKSLVRNFRVFFNCRCRNVCNPFF